MSPEDIRVVNFTGEIPEAIEDKILLAAKFVIEAEDRRDMWLEMPPGDSANMMYSSAKESVRKAGFMWKRIEQQAGTADGHSATDLSPRSITA